ncbi:MAG: hypothetical protein V9E90_03060 [Saprospiraceae bacterium]
MKFNLILSSAIILFLALTFNSIGQKSIQINGTKAFIKSNVKLSLDVSHITACNDTKLTKNCKYYFLLVGTEFQETTLTSTEANSISKTKNLTGLKNVNTEKVNKQVSLSYIDKSNSRIYFVGYGKNLNIVEYSNPPGTVAKRPSSTKLNACKNACQDAKSKCFEDCIFGTSSESVFSNCYDGCALSFLGCTGICEKYVKKVQIALNNILVKPISFQTK